MRQSEPLKLHQNKSGSLPLLGDHKFTGRDSLVFLVDASKEMFITGEDGQPSNFDMTMQVKWPVIIVFFALSLLGIVTFDVTAFLVL